MLKNRNRLCQYSDSETQGAEYLMKPKLNLFPDAEIRRYMFRVKKFSEKRMSASNLQDVLFLFSVSDIGKVIKILIFTA